MNCAKRNQSNQLNQKAFTLIELLITLSLALILSGMALPSFNELLENSKLMTQVDDLAKTLRASRTTAIYENSKVTICPTNDSHTCISDWSAGYMSFVDKNGDRNLNDDEEILTIYTNKNNKASLNWRAFGFRKSIQWLETGITNHQNGTFYFCHEDATKSRALIITKAGRIRYSKDTDGDDLHESANGKPLNC